MIYLDNNATTELLPEVRDALASVVGLGPSNPSSSHDAGSAARRIIGEERQHVADLIGASEEEVFFTSSGTEANNWALNQVTHTGKHLIITTPIEHDSVLRKVDQLTSAGCKAVYLPVDREGRVSIEELAALLKSDVGMVSMQWVNNETGVIQPIEDVAKLCRQHGVPLHTDAAQAVGKLEINMASTKIDYLTFTGHKFHAPMGIGVLYRRAGVPLRPFIAGGLQETGLRAGSENLLGIAGIGAAAAIRAKQLHAVQDQIQQLRDYFEQCLLDRIQGLEINGGDAQARVCNTSNVRFPGVDGEALVAQLALRDIYCSQGSACISQIPEPSYVLRAMGQTAEEARASIRFSLSELNTIGEIDEAIDAIADVHQRLRAFQLPRENVPSQEVPS